MRSFGGCLPSTRVEVNIIKAYSSKKIIIKAYSSKKNFSLTSYTRQLAFLFVLLNKISRGLGLNLLEVIPTPYQKSILY